MRKLSPEELEAVIDNAKAKTNFKIEFEAAVAKMKAHFAAHEAAKNINAMFEFATMIYWYLYDKRKWKKQTIDSLIKGVGDIAVAVNEKQIDFNLIRETLRDEIGLDLVGENAPTILFGGKGILVDIDCTVSFTGGGSLENPKRLHSSDTELLDKLQLSA